MELNTEQAKDRAMDKIRKLLAMARDGRGNEHEAAAAASQAEKLMRYWQIDSAEEIMQEIEKNEAFERELEDVSFEGLKGHVPKQVPPWVGFVALGCGILFTCKVDIVNSPLGLKVRFSGYQMDVMLCRWVYRILCEAVFRVSKEQCKGLGMSAAKSFRLGAAVRLLARLRELKEERDNENHVAWKAGTNTGMVLYDKKKSRVEEMYGATQTKSSKTSASNPAAYMAGRNAADKINIPTNRPLGNTSDHKRLN